MPAIDIVRHDVNPHESNYGLREDTSARGVDLAGATITATYVDGSVEVLTWEAFDPYTNGGVNGTNINMIYGYNWHELTTTKLLASLEIDLQPASSVFDTTLTNDGDPLGGSTPGSKNGFPFKVSTEYEAISGSLAITYSGVVNLVGRPADGDLYTTMLVDFTGLATGGLLGDLDWNSDIDTMEIAGDLVPAALVGQVITGTEDPDVLAGGLGPDTIFGLAGDDIITGGDGDDLIDGGAGADILTAGANALGGDTLSYATSDGGVNVSLLANTASGGHATGDTISSFENVTGSDHGDTLKGDGGDNGLNGGAGDDVFVDTDGSDLYIGGIGTDTVQFALTQSSYEFAQGSGGELLAVAGGDTDTVDSTVEWFEFLDTTVGFADVLAAIGNTPPVGTVTITGTAEIGSLLTAVVDVTDAEGIIASTESYQWSRDGVAIDGATSASYLITSEDNGKQLTVAYSYEDGAGTAESVASAAVVAQLPAIELTILRLEGNPHESIYGLREDTSTRGVDLAGTSITATYDDGSVETLIWQAFDSYTYGGVNGTNINMLYGYNWHELTTTKLLASLEINLQPASSAFDTTLTNDGDPLGGSTPGSKNGFPFKVAPEDQGISGSATVTYSGVVNLDGRPADGDLYTTMVVDFTGLPAGGLLGELNWNSDIDTMKYAGDLVLAGTVERNLTGTDDPDELEGGAGNDVLFGLDGKDVLKGQQGDDTLDGGAWGDVLQGGSGNDVLYGGAGKDTLKGQQGHDTMDGGTGEDVLKGGNGNDVLYGDADDDVLKGQNGKDTLDGGLGNDVMDGGNGSDTFVFTSGMDTIKGFDANDDTEEIDMSSQAAIANFLGLILDGHVMQIGNDVVINDFVGNTLTLLNVSATDLHETDFIF